VSIRTDRSRNTIIGLRPLAYKLSPSASRQRGLAAIGIELESPVAMQRVDSGATVVVCSEEQNGELVGELAVEVFRAALVIDRDGILEEKAHDAADAEHGRATPPVPVTLPGASGFRAEVVRGKQQLPYVYLFAVAPDDLGVDGGVLVTVRSASPDWPAANEILRTLRVLGRRATTNRAANDDAEVLQLPLLPPLGPPLRR
jgi:hypothetical protein